jgi:S1-C subfamily serine protease
VLGIYLVDENHMDDGAGLIRELGGNLVVNHVISGSRAERMGLKLADVIKRINGKDMSTADDVLAEVRNSETVEIEIIRDGKNLTLGEPVPSP